MRPIIEIQNLGKEYRLGEQQAGYSTFREAMLSTLGGPLRRLRSRPPVSESTVWALRDISFDVMPGEVLGVIGRNGAGKSTLLKVLSRITEPTTGSVKLYGRVGSLLEVGTGFHPELTGRENIFLNGAILGMRRAEISQKFDEIVAFAEVEKFLDTPVKRYSSGMYMRLAFAVAAHLQPEILVVDEVLAVGDTAFQKKCLGKMGEVAREGRTVLFVSHNMAAVEALCTRAVLLSQGQLKSSGAPRDLISEYLASALDTSSGTQELTGHAGRVGGSTPVMTQVALLADAPVPTSSVSMGDDLTVQVSFASPDRPVRPVLGLHIKTAQGVPVFGVSNRFMGGYATDDAVSEGVLSCRLERLPLTPGTYFVDLFFGDLTDVSRDLDVVQEAISFEVVPSDVYGTGKLMPPGAGPIFWPATWEFRAPASTGGLGAGLVEAVER